MPRHAASEVVLVCAPVGRDAELVCALLARRGLASSACASGLELRAAVAGEAGCAIVAEEALDGITRAQLAETLARQQPWSDFPLVVLRAAGSPSSGPAADRLISLGNVTMLDRPVRARTLIAAVEVALRGRRRQYAARRAIQRRDDFLAMLGHELRNPLGAVVLATELIQRTIAAPSPIERHIEVIDRQTRNLTRLVDDLLDVSRVTSGKVVLQRANLALDDVLARSVQLVEQEAEARSLSLELARAGEGVRLEGDPVRLEQVFGNLLKNAVKYSPPGASITVSARAERDRCEVRVRDTGIGMTPEMLGRAFELFSQAESSLDRAQGGLGVGLTMVRSLVELHGGSVEARSEGLGKGTEIVVRLPRAAAVDATDTVEPAAAEPAVAGLPRLSVVLIEDNEDLRDTSQIVLEELGCRVAVAGDGREGLERILSLRPDVALVDIGLPTMDGYAVAAEVRQALGAEPVLIALTGYGQPQDRERALGAGFDEHLTKPISIAALRQALALASRRGGNSAAAPAVSIA